MTDFRNGDSVRDNTGTEWRVERRYDDRFKRETFCELTCIKPGPTMNGIKAGEFGRRPVRVLELVKQVRE